jgi:hypothetical protein
VSIRAPAATFAWLATTWYALTGDPAGLRSNCTVLPVALVLRSNAGLLILVMLSPLTPESLFGSSTGAEGGAGMVDSIWTVAPPLAGPMLPAMSVCAAV